MVKHGTLVKIMANHDTWNACQDHGKIRSNYCNLRACDIGVKTIFSCHDLFNLANTSPIEVTNWLRFLKFANEIEPIATKINRI